MPSGAETVRVTASENPFNECTVIVASAEEPLLNLREEALSLIDTSGTR